MTTTTPRATTKSPLAFTRAAPEVARAALPAYSSARSWKDFTLHQHVALLALELFLKTDDRGLAAQVAEWSDLRDALGLTTVPHFTALQKARARLKRRTPTPSGVPPPRRPPRSEANHATCRRERGVRATVIALNWRGSRQWPMATYRRQVVRGFRKKR